MPNKTKFYIYVPILIGLFFAGGIYMGSTMQSTNNGTKRVFKLPVASSNKLNDIINYINNEYVDDVEKEALVDKAIKTILEDLDPHSYYISAADLQAMSEPLEGSFEGIGVQFSIQKDTVVVVTPVNGGPSEKVGVLSGDRIVKVNGELIAGNGVTNRKVMEMLKGEKGTPVNITVWRNGSDTVNFEIIRDKIPIYSMDIAYMVNEKTGLIKLSRFSKTTYQEFMKGATKLKEKGMENLILDLRGNGGGFMDAAIKIVDEFLEEGELIVFTEGRARPRQNYYATSNNAFADMNLAVLIDEGSASASEIIAGAIQDNDRGIIIGRRSFGKGLVQEQSAWPDGSATRLTIARYHTPTGRCIQRPYNNGTDKYESDYKHRWESGELYTQDSISFPDSLKYKTPGGRTVYGGGGIMPDQFIPVDTSGGSYYYTELLYGGIFYQFAFQYADRNREMLNEFKGYQEFVDYFDAHQKEVLQEFTQFGEKKGVEKDPNGFLRSKERITQRLQAQIARNIWDNDGFYPILFDTDPTVKQATEVLKKPTDLALFGVEESNKS